MCSGPVGRSPVSTRYFVGFFRKSTRRAFDRRTAASKVSPPAASSSGPYGARGSLIDYYHSHAVTEPTDFESSPDAYRVKLESFEGPLDLLLHLIRKNEMNIYDIKISVI